MKILGYLMLTVGFLAGAVAAVQTAENEVSWNLFLPSLAVGLAGVILAHVGTRRAALQESKLAGDFEKLTSSLDRLVESVGRLNAEKKDADPYAIHTLIDERLRDDLEIFAEARESIGHLFTLADYADVMNSFAAGERYVNRVWSASIDGWVDELREYLERANSQFLEVQAKLRALGPTRTA